MDGYDARRIEPPNGPAPGDGEPPVGVGEAADGLIRVTAVDGRLSAVDINPRAMRTPSEDLAGHLAEAANAALDDLATQFPASDLPELDLGRLDAQLAEAQQQAAIQMRQYDQSINEALRQGGL